MTHPWNVAATALALSGCAFLTTSCTLVGSQNTEGSSSYEVDVAEAGDGGSEIERLINDARAAEGSAELLRAKGLYDRALEVDPNNPDAAQGQTRVSAALGMRVRMTDTEDGDTGSIAEAASEVVQVRRDQLRMDAETKIQQGQVHLNQQHFDEAIGLFEGALLIVQYNPFLEGMGLTEPAIQAMIDQAKIAQVAYDREAEKTRGLIAEQEKREREGEARARVSRQIMLLYQAANKEFQRDNFHGAAALLQSLLDLDPTNVDAQRMLTMSKDAERQGIDRAQTRAMKENWRQTFDEMIAEIRPQVDLLNFADDRDWRRISERGPLEFSTAGDITSPEERAVLDKLNSTPVNITFTETPLSDAVAWFSTLTDVNFILSSDVLAEDPPFSLTAGPMPAMEALQLLIELAEPPMKYRVKDGVVHILTAEEAVGGQILEIYDVRDLTFKVGSFPAKDFNLAPSGFSDDDFGDDPPEAIPTWEAAALADLILNNIARDSWSEDPSNVVTELAGSLVVRQTPDVQRMIRSLLDDLRENMGTLVNVETRFITVTDSFLEDIGVDFRGLGPDSTNPAASANIPSGLTLDDFGSIPDGFGTPSNPSGIGTDNDLGVFNTDLTNGDVRARSELLYDSVLGNTEFTNAGGLSLQATFLDETLVEIVLRAVSKYGMSNITDAPSLTLYNNQRANISMINHVSYVADFDVEIAQAAVIGQPVVKVLQEGVVLDVRPVVSADKRFITMELRPTVADLKRPIDTFTTNLSIGSDVTIELPILRIKRARTTVTMPDGSTLMIGGWKVIEDQDFQSGIPFLNRIPLLGVLFERKGKFLDKRKLLILVKAQIVISKEHEPTYGLGR